MLNSKIMWKNNKENKKLKRTINEVETANINLNDYILLDVRSRREFSENHLMGAINMPLIDLKRKIEKYINNKNAKILVYCQSGIRSKKAIEIMNKMGYTNLFNLKGGLENIE